MLFRHEHDHGLEYVDLVMTTNPVWKVQRQVHGQGVQLERHEEGDEGGKVEVLQESPWGGLEIVWSSEDQPFEFGKLKHSKLFRTLDGNGIWTLSWELDMVGDMMFVKDNCYLWDKEWRVVPIRETIKVALTLMIHHIYQKICVFLLWDSGRHVQPGSEEASDQVSSDTRDSHPSFCSWDVFTFLRNLQQVVHPLHLPLPRSLPPISHSGSTRASV